MITLEKSGASSSGPPPLRRDITSETADAYSALLTLLPQDLLVLSSKAPNGPHTPNHPLLARSLEFQSSLVADLAFARNFNDQKIWYRCVAVYEVPWLGEDASSKFAEAVCSHFHAIDQVNDVHSTNSPIYSRQSIRLSMLWLSTILARKANYSAILFSLWPMVPSSFFLTPNFVCSEAADTVFSEAMVPGSLLSCANYETAK